MNPPLTMTEAGGNVIRLVQGDPAGNDSRRASRDHDVDQFMIVQCDQVREARQPEHRQPPPRPRRRSRYRRRPLPYRRMAHDHEQAWGGLTLAFYTDWPTSFWISGGRAIMNPLPTPLLWRAMRARAIRFNGGRIYQSRESPAADCEKQVRFGSSAVLPPTGFGGHKSRFEPPEFWVRH